MKKRSVVVAALLVVVLVGSPASSVSTCEVRGLQYKNGSIATIEFPKEWILAVGQRGTPVRLLRQRGEGPLVTFEHVRAVIFYADRECQADRG